MSLFGFKLPIWIIIPMVVFVVAAWLIDDDFPFDAVVMGECDGLSRTEIVEKWVDGWDMKTLCAMGE